MNETREPTLFEAIVASLADLSEQERGRLRYLLTQPGCHRRGDPDKVGTNVILTAKG